MSILEWSEALELKKIQQAVITCEHLEANVQFVRDTVNVSVVRGGKKFEGWGHNIVTAVRKLEEEINKQE